MKPLLSPSRIQRMTLIGIGCVALTYIASLVMFTFIKPEVASSIASLGQVTIVAFSGMIATFIGAQGYVEGKAITPTPPTPPTPPAS